MSSERCVVLAANSAWNILNFRMNIVAAVRDLGVTPIALVPPGEGVEALRTAGLRVRTIAMNPGGVSPVEDSLLIARYFAALRELKPAAFLGFTAKPNIYGSIAASMLRIPAINNVTGLGTSFIHGGPLGRIVSLLYRLALRSSRRVFFHNADDLGFFANRNFMGTLLLVSIPFTFALLAERSGKPSSVWAMRAIGAASLLVILVGLALNRSLAALALSVPVTIASVALLKRPASFIRYVLPVAALTALAAVLIVTAIPVGSEVAGADTSSIDTRTEIWSTTLKAIGDSFPAGTGFGSFVPVYATYENPDLVDQTYINNAHNDYLQVVLEGGLPGVLLIGALLSWWALQVMRIWRSPTFSPMTRAATIAAGAILFHSAVDYPLRTSAIAAVFAFCLGMMAQPAEGRTGGSTRFQRARHVSIG